MLKQRNACSGSGTSVAFMVHKTVIPRLRFDFRTPPFYKLSCTLFLLFIQLPAYVTPKAICALLRFEANAAGFCADPFFTNCRCSASSDLRQSGLVWLCTRSVTTDLCGVRSTMSSGFEQEYFSAVSQALRYHHSRRSPLSSAAALSPVSFWRCTCSASVSNDARPFTVLLQSGVANRTMASAAKDEKYDFDLFTIGGGTGGVRAARFASMDYGPSSLIPQLQ